MFRVRPTDGYTVELYDSPAFEFSTREEAERVKNYANIQLDKQDIVHYWYFVDDGRIVYCTDCGRINQTKGHPHCIGGGYSDKDKTHS